MSTNFDGKHHVGGIQVNTTEGAPVMVVEYNRHDLPHTHMLSRAPTQKHTHTRSYIYVTHLCTTHARTDSYIHLRLHTKCTLYNDCRSLEYGTCLAIGV